MVLSQTERQSNKELNILNEVAKALTGHLDLPEILKAAMDRISELIGPAEFGMILLWDPTEGLFRVHATCGQGVKDHSPLYEMRLREDESITGQVFATTKPQVYVSPAEIKQARGNMSPRNQALLQQAFGSSEANRSFLGAPLCAGDQKYGVMLLGTLHGPEGFTESDIPFIQTLADLIALAIDRARLEFERENVEQAEQADRMRAEALAILSHELRTPLASIKGYATALMLDEVQWSLEKQGEFLQLIDQETDNLQTMISEILDSSLIDIGQFVLEYQPVRLEHLAQEVAEDMQRRTEIHQFIVDFSPDFPIVDADIRRIRQVIRNIIDNAIKYSPDGGLIVIRGEARKNDVVVSISDQGVGISPEDLIPLFDKYFRVKSATGFYVPGTGLGLPVARALIEEHHGHIWAESKVGEGTTLYFSLPLSQFDWHEAE